MNELSNIAQLGQNLYEAEKEVLRLEAELKRAQRRRDAIAITDLPEAMASIGETGMESFKTSEFCIEIKESLSVSPKVENRPLVLQELEKTGHGALIKSTVQVAFNRGQEDAAKALIDELQKQGLDVKQDRTVAPATLKKHVKTLLEKGEDVDTELFGVYRFRKAQFSDGAPEAPIFEDEE